MSNSGNSSDSQARSRPQLVREPLWLAGAVRGKNHNLVANVRNAVLYLEGCPFLPAEFHVAHDEMLRAIVCGMNHEPLNDEILSRLINWFESLGEPGFKHYPAECLRHAIAVVAGYRRFNPLQDALADLKWDGCERIHSWLTRYLGAEDNKYHTMAGAMFLRSMIARAMMPGCKADYMLVLEGPQRALKSTVCSILARGYFSDSLPDLAGDHVRISMHLRGKWVIEISELHAISRADQSRLKQWLSSPFEQYTPKYGRGEVIEPRTCVFIGTTNQKKYLRDETGGTRYWPVECGNIDAKRLERDINQLLAEAYHQVIVEKRTWWPPDDDQEKIFAPRQDDRYQGDAWEQPIANWDKKIPDHQDGQACRAQVNPPFYLAQIAEGALNIKPGLLRKAEEMRLAQVLDFMGWIRAKRTMHGTPWFPPAT